MVPQCYGSLGDIEYGPALLSASNEALMGNLTIVYATEPCNFSTD